ncbi:MAG: sigma-B regulation protein RsbU (phosphoserine phosphatase) [Candidatus Omnitrophota bacterium]|jgi:sigma-B regulation protein RsbU (phosphoserine phosphatase)
METIFQFDSSDHILVVDDDPITYKLLSKLLEKEGHRTSHAIDGKVALELMSENTYNLILLDWIMPGLSGPDVIKVMKSNKDMQSLPVIMLSSKNSSADIKEGLDAGANDYAIKPIIVPELLARIRAVLRTQKLQDELEQQLKGVAEIQAQLLPQALPSYDDFAVDVFYQPSDQSGGDYYDVFSINDRYVAIIVADVAGHGAPAMVTMALTRCFLKMKCSQEISPAKALCELARDVDSQIPFFTFITMFYSVYDRETRELAFSSAGHSDPLYFNKAKNSLVEIKVEAGRPLKMLEPESSFAETKVKMGVGDGLLLCTDGYFEVANESEERMEEEGMNERFLTAVQKDKPLKYMVDEWNEFIGSAHQDDDVTLVYVKF